MCVAVEVQRFEVIAPVVHAVGMEYGWLFQFGTLEVRRTPKTSEMPEKRIVLVPITLVQKGDYRHL